MTEEVQKEKAQGSLSNSDYMRVGEVIDKQDLYSKSARKSWLAKKYIMPMIWYNIVMFFLLLCCFFYSVYYFFNKPSPLFLYEGSDGKISCAKAYIKEDGEFFPDLSEKQKEVCKLLKRNEK